MKIVQNENGKYNLYIHYNLIGEFESWSQARMACACLMAYSIRND